MKKNRVCSILALCIILAGCAGGGQKAQKPEPARQPDAPPEVQDSKIAPSAPPEIPVYADAYTGRWRDTGAPQWVIDIHSADGSGYTIEIQGSGVVWEAAGEYDEIWQGVAYMGAKYENAAAEDGAAERRPIPDREEVTGFICLEEDGTLTWIDDFDHAGDELHFAKEQS